MTNEVIEKLKNKVLRRIKMLNNYYSIKVYNKIFIDCKNMRKKKIVYLRKALRHE